MLATLQCPMKFRYFVSALWNRTLGTLTSASATIAKTISMDFLSSISLLFLTAPHPRDGSQFFGQGGEFFKVYVIGPYGRDHRLRDGRSGGAYEV